MFSFWYSPNSSPVDFFNLVLSFLDHHIRFFKNMHASIFHCLFKDSLASSHPLLPLQFSSSLLLFHLLSIDNFFFAVFCLLPEIFPSQKIFPVNPYS